MIILLNLASLVLRFVNSFKGFVNTLIAYISKFAITLLNILPNSPFQASIEKVAESDTLGTLDWAIPFTTFFSIGLTWTVAVAVYYVISVALRWVKAID